MVLLWIGLSVLAIAVAVKIFAKLTCGRYEITEDLSLKTILITGASGGIGEVTARELARHGATVHMLCRNLEKSNKIADRIKSETKNDRVHVWELDTSKLESVRKFAQKYLATRFPIDVLINNAGIMFQGIPKREITEDGLELTMATNHYGHFLLTNLLLDKIKENPKARIVNISSIGHWTANFDIENVNLENGYSGHRAYANSKLANILFTRELAERINDTGVTVNCLHPGAVNTELFRYTGGVRIFLMSLIFPWFKTPEEGAQCTLYLALAPELKNVTGEYFWDCAKATVSWRARDKKLAQKFWDISTKYTKFIK